LAVASGGLAIFPGNGDGTFGARVDYQTGGSTSLAAGDLDGDGNVDLALANPEFNTVSVLLGRGDGTFGTKTDYGSGNGPRSVAIDDVNRDGKADLAVANNLSKSVVVLLNVGARSQVRSVLVDFDPDVISLRSRASLLTAYIEPVGFDPAAIDPFTVRLAGEVPALVKFATIGDHDEDGTPDLRVKFSRAALDPLLTPGECMLEVTGVLVSGERFRGGAAVRVMGLPQGKLGASVAPNPMNPAAVLSFSTTRLGAATVRIFDIHGRRVRTLMDVPALPAGVHELSVDGRGAEGEALASGLYFYRVETAEGVEFGRLTVLR
jgi:hypothetical protein